VFFWYASKFDNALVIDKKIAMFGEGTTVPALGIAPVKDGTGASKAANPKRDAS
jgi:hypothetical protein